MLPIIPFLFLASSLAADSLGCFSSVDTSNAKGFQTYGSQSSCSGACGPDYPYVAMRDGAYCYCLTSMPSSNQVADSQCNVRCNGYGSVNCGGSSVFTVFTGQGQDPDSGSNSGANSGSIAASLSDSTDSLAASRPTQASSKPSSNSSPSISEDAPSSITSVTTASGTGDSSVESVKYRTVTQTSGSDSTGTSSSSSRPEEQKKQSSIGPIVGGVVGGVAGALILGFAAFFLIRRHNGKDEDDEEEFYKKGTSGGTLNRGVSSKSQKFNSVFDMPMSNPFVHPSDEFAEKRASASAGDELSDPRLNPAMMGRRRLSEGSLADEADYSRKILGVANP